MSLRKSHEVYCVSRYSDSQLRIIFWMFVCIYQCSSIEYIYIEVMRMLSKVSIHHIYKVFYLFFLVSTNSIWYDRECI